MSAKSGLERLGALEFPQRFPIVQFPNPPLATALLAGLATDFTSGSTERYLQSVSYLGLAVWAYQELTEGVNWFRRLLGLAFVVVLVVRVARAIHS
jgi:hypothetical protein